MGAVSHPRVPRVVDVSRTGRGTPYLMMQRAPGRSLRPLLPRLSRRRATALVDDLLGVLTEVHASGIVHCDVKASNLRVAEGEVWLLDFGIARRGARRWTRQERARGTPAYMAPEQLEGRRVDARTDLYAVGVLLYRAWFGVLPFPREGFGLLRRKRRALYVPPSIRDPRFEPADDLFRRLLAGSARARLASARKARAALATIRRRLPRTILACAPDGEPSATRRTRHTLETHPA